MGTVLFKCFPYVGGEIVIGLLVIAILLLHINRLINKKIDIIFGKCPTCSSGKVDIAILHSKDLTIDDVRKHIRQQKQRI